MQDKPQTARFGMTLFLNNPLHRQAWEILSAIRRQDAEGTALQPQEFPI